MSEDKRLYEWILYMIDRSLAEAEMYQDRSDEAATKAEK